MHSQAFQQEIGALIQQGVAALQQKKAAEARAAFETIIEKGAGNASVWLGLAYACRDLGDTPAMDDAVDRSIAIEPRNSRALILKADGFAEKGDKRAAAAFYVRALNMAPPPEHTPNDLRAELVRAQQSFIEFSQDFERHLTSHMAEKLEAAGATASRVRESLELMTGKRQLQMPSVQYAPKPKNYYFPGLPIVEFYDEGKLSWVLEVEAATDQIRDELRQVIGQPDVFSPYVKGDENRPQSDPHGMKNNDNWSAFYLWKDGELVPENAAMCPVTVELMKKLVPAAIPGRAPNVLFSLLRGGASIPPHHGLINTRFICHLPLIVPDGCGFRVGGETRDWEEGKVWAFDDTIEHEAWNNSDQDRYILLFEIWRPEMTETEQALVAEIFQAIDNYGA